MHKTVHNLKKLEIFLNMCHIFRKIQKLRNSKHGVSFNYWHLHIVYIYATIKLQVFRLRSAKVPESANNCNKHNKKIEIMWNNCENMDEIATTNNSNNFFKSMWNCDFRDFLLASLKTYWHFCVETCAIFRTVCFCLRFCEFTIWFGFNDAFASFTKSAKDYLRSCVGAFLKFKMVKIFNRKAFKCSVTFFPPKIFIKQQNLQSLKNT